MLQDIFISIVYGFLAGGLVMYWTMNNRVTSTHGVLVQIYRLKQLRIAKNIISEDEAESEDEAPSEDEAQRMVYAKHFYAASENESFQENHKQDDDQLESKLEGS